MSSRGSPRRWQGRMAQMYGPGTDRARRRARDGSSPELSSPRARPLAWVAALGWFVAAALLFWTGWILLAVFVLVAGIIGSLVFASASRRTYDD